jgi:PIN domain nuclease of toxin-antitoxin system
VADARSAVVLDSSAVIAFMLGEAGEPAVAALLGSAKTCMTTVNAAEVVDVLVRVHGVDGDDVVARLEELLTTVEPIGAALDLAVRAGEVRARHFRRDQRVSLADCFVIATAQPGDRIATTDRTLAAVAREEGYEVVELG